VQLIDIPVADPVDGALDAGPDLQPGVGAQLAHGQAPRASNSARRTPAIFAHSVSACATTWSML